MIVVLTLLACWTNTDSQSESLTIRLFRVIVSRTCTVKYPTVNVVMQNLHTSTYSGTVPRGGLTDAGMAYNATLWLPWLARRWARRLWVASQEFLLWQRAESLAPGGYQGLVVWWRAVVTTPVSSTVSFTVPAGYTQSRDWTNTVTTGLVAGSTIQQVGGRPILLENFTGCVGCSGNALTVGIADLQHHVAGDQWRERHLLQGRRHLHYSCKMQWRCLYRHERNHQLVYCQSIAA